VVRWQKKHVCGCEGMVAGKGSHTLAFVGWLFHFLLLSLCSKNSMFNRVVGCFFGLLVTFCSYETRQAAYCFRVNL
jgi:hypothetical protein